MKIRIGVGSAGASSTPESLAELVGSIDEFGFDSLWLSEVLTGPVIDPVVGLAWAAATNPHVAPRQKHGRAELYVRIGRGRLVVTMVTGLTYYPVHQDIG